MVIRYCWEQEIKTKGRKRGRKDEARYYGYLFNFVTSQWYKLDDKDVDDVKENVMLLDVREKAYMLHYICNGSEEYNLCYQADKSLFPSLKVNHQQYHEVIIFLLHQIPLIQ
jgi:hypothetical protein